MSKGKKRKPFGKSGMLEPETHIIMNLGKRKHKTKSEQEKSKERKQRRRQSKTTPAREEVKYGEEEEK
jgi:hypothetical protein